MIEVEKNIPLPVRNTSTKPRRYVKYPFDMMVEGDSFFIPYDGVEPFRLQSLVLTAAKRKIVPVNITTSKLADGLRVWRLA